jgi:replication factor C subunit 3/5
MGGKDEVADVDMVEKKETDNLPWVEKYRPLSLQDLISHEDIIQTINALIDKNKLPHMLLYGPAGTGKTSTILACARKVHGPKFSSMILELNASDERGIDVVREQIKNFASSRQLFSSGFKLIILDEADSMTKTAQMALRRVIEKYTKNTRFCLICNYVNKIIPALQSRCTRFRFGPLGSEQAEGRIKEIAQKEGVVLEQEGLEAIVDLAGGDMRKCLNVLQATHLAYPVVNEENVYRCTGKPLPQDVRRILEALLNSPFQDAYDAILKMQVDKGLSLTDIITYVHELFLQTRFPPKVVAHILDKMATIEYNLAFGVEERLQLASFVGAFHIAQLMVMEEDSKADKS